MDQFVEIKNWGLNFTTISSLATLVFTVLQGWSMVRQVEEIHRDRSGKSVPILMYAFFMTEFFAFSIYGYRFGRLVEMINGFLGFFYLWVYFVATRYEDGGKRRWWHFALLFTVPLMFVFPYPEALIGILLGIACLTLLECPWKIFKNKSRGAVNASFLWMFLWSVLFWTVYAFCVHDWVMFTSSAFGTAIMIVTLYLWKKYP